MVKGRTLLWQMAGLLLLSAVCALAVGYNINFPLLQETLNARVMADAAHRTGRVVHGLRELITNTERHLLVFIRHDQPLRTYLAQVRHGGRQDPEEVHPALLRLFGHLTPDQLVVSNIHGNTVFAAGRELTPGAPANLPGLHNILSGRSGAGFHMLLEPTDGDLRLLLLHPILSDSGQVVGVVAVGYQLRERVAALSAAMGGEPVFLATREGLVGYPGGAPGWPALNPLYLVQAINGSAPVLTTVLEEGERGWYFIRFTLEGLPHLVMASPVDLRQAREVIAESRANLHFSSVVILAMVALLGWGMFLLFLDPVRKLTGKARVLVAVCSGQGLGLPKPPGEGRNELETLNHTFEYASLLVYGQIAHLLDREHTLGTLARKDYLTGLGNHTAFQEQLSATLALGRRTHHLMALLLVDLVCQEGGNALDGLDRMTREAIFKGVSYRIKESLRESDSLFRLERVAMFAILLPECESREKVTHVADRLCDVISWPFDVEGHTFRPAPRMGIAIFPEHGEKAPALLTHAVAALEAAHRQQEGYVLEQRGEDKPKLKAL